LPTELLNYVFITGDIMKKQVMALFAASALIVSFNAAAAGDAAAGKSKSAACAACHGATGTSMAPNFPNLKGQKDVYLVTQLKAFRAGTRKNATMEPMAKPLSDADIDNLAAYFSSQK
jgi:cytochrome c553